MATTLHIQDFGACPNNDEDAAPAFLKAIEAARGRAGPVTLAVAQGRYDFYPEGAARAPYYISNTASEAESPDVTGTIGLLFQGLKDITLEGNGFLFVFYVKPRTESGRTCAGFADLIHVSGCRGVVRIENSLFEGA